MSENLRKQMKVLKIVSSISNKSKRREKLDHLSNDPNFTRAVRELCLNLVQKHLPLDEFCKKRLVRNKRQIKCCAKENVSQRTRRKQIVEAAEYLPYLVPYADSFLRSNIKRIRPVESSRIRNGNGESSNSNYDS